MTEVLVAFDLEGNGINRREIAFESLVGRENAAAKIGPVRLLCTTSTFPQAVTAGT